MNSADEELSSVFAPPRTGRRSADAAPQLRPRRLPDPVPPRHPIEVDVQRYYLCCEEPSGEFVEVIVAVSDSGRRRYFATTDGAAFVEVDDAAFARRNEDGARSLLELNAREIDELEAELEFVRPVRGRDPLAEIAAAAAAAAADTESDVVDDADDVADELDEGESDDDVAAAVDDADDADADDVDGFDDDPLGLAALLPKAAARQQAEPELAAAPEPEQEAEPDLTPREVFAGFADSEIPAWLAEYVEYQAAVAEESTEPEPTEPEPGEAEAEADAEVEPAADAEVVPAAAAEPAAEPAVEAPAEAQPVDAVEPDSADMPENGSVDRADGDRESKETVMDEFEAMVMGFTADSAAPAAAPASHVAQQAAPAAPSAPAVPVAPVAPRAAAPAAAVAPAAPLLDASAQVALAKGIAFVAHRGQLDRTGAEYIDHPGRVAEHFDAATEPVAAAAAWLHDVLEDSEMTAHELLNAGVLPEVVDAVETLTRRPEASETEYYGRIARHELARRVKLADIADNAAPWRLRKLDFAEQARLVEKYRHAREALGA